MEQAIGYPWFFNEVKHFFKYKTQKEQPSLFERIDMAERHLKMSIDWKGEKLGVLETRRHYSNYFKNIPDFKQYRTQMVTLDYPEELFELFNNLKREFSHEKIFI